MTYDEICDKIEKGGYDPKAFGVEWPEEMPPKKSPARREFYERWHEAQAKCTAAFKADLEKVFEVEGHPKADRVFELAWEHGHSSGYREVLNYYSDFVELVK